MATKKKSQTNKKSNTKQTSTSNKSKTSLKLEILNAFFQGHHTIKQQLYKYQKDFIKTVDQHNFIIINKSRQLGLSTLLAAYALYQAIFLEQTILIVSPSERQSIHMMNYIKEFYHIIAKRLQLEEPVSTRKEIRFAGGGEIYSLPNSPNTVRGFRAHIIIFDEYAHFLNNTDKETLEAVWPSISRGGKLILNSTPFGETGEYYRIWTETNDFKKITINYKECPDLDIETIKANYDEVSFQQEYNNQFIGEENSFFPYTLLKECINTELQTNTNFDKDCTYHLGIDFGRKKDLTAIIGYEKRIITGKTYKHIKIYKEFRNTPFREQLAYIKTLLNHSNVTTCSVDASGMGLPLYEELKTEYHSKVRPITFTNQLKEQMMVGLKVQLERKEIILPNERKLIDSLHMIQRKQTAGRHVQFDSDRNDRS
jgi:phage FluMu gp28-like protein